VESECTLNNSIVLAIFVPKIIKVSGNLRKLWQKQFWLFFETQCNACIAVGGITDNTPQCVGDVATSLLLWHHTAAHGQTENPLNTLSPSSTAITWRR